MNNTKLILVKVTQDHIDNGVREDGCHCPVALALSELEVFQNVDRTKPVALVDEKFGRPFVQANRAWKANSAEGYKLPLEAKAFVQAFDTGRKVQPFEFELDLNKPKYR